MEFDPVEALQASEALKTATRASFEISKQARVLFDSVMNGRVTPSDYLQQLAATRKALDEAQEEVRKASNRLGAALDPLRRR